MASVFVAGGGPAGLAAAIALRQEGCEVSVADCAAPPIDKVCGEGLMPGSVAVLRQLGVVLPANAGFPLEGIRFVDSGNCATARFLNGPGLGLRRTVLHEVLVSRAAALGVRLRWNVKDVQIDTLRADLIVGADGQNSRVRREARLHRIRSEHQRYGFRRHYRIAPWSSYVEVYWGRQRQIYVTPVAYDEVCIASLSSDAHVRVEQSLADFPELTKRLAKAPQLGVERGALSVSRRLQHVQQGNLALVGDASGSVDAITGEGMCLAFKQAVALASAYKSEKLTGYESAHRAASRTPHAMAWLLLTMGSHAGLRRRAIASLAKRPEIFHSLLKVHLGEASPFVEFVEFWGELLSGLTPGTNTRHLEP